MPAPVHNFAHLSHRQTEADARLVLAAPDASGLGSNDLVLRSGVHVKRLWIWRSRLGLRVPGDLSKPLKSLRSPKIAECSLMSLRVRGG